jgi:hypothetical protein
VKIGRESRISGLDKFTNLSILAISFLAAFSRFAIPVAPVSADDPTWSDPGPHTLDCPECGLFFLCGK